MREIAPDVPNVVSIYFGFLDRLGARLREGRNEAHSISPILDALPGLEPLLRSFPIASQTERVVTRRRVEDWNPLGQRLLLPDETPISASEFEAEFSLITVAAQTLVEWAHEAVHVLAVEPWCAGQRPFRTFTDFQEWYLAAEGLAFWYADIVVTRAIRQHVPGAELVYTRSSVSNAGFHPEEAFRRVGYEDQRDLLRLYLAAFIGRDEVLAGSGDILAAQYGVRLQGFYRDSGKTLFALWTVLEQQDMLNGYWSRFCAIPGLPALSNGSQLHVSGHKAIYQIGNEILPSLATLSSQDVAAVRTRRAAQIRAWHGWSFSTILRRGWIMTMGLIDAPKLTEAVGAYLSEIERALHLLAGGDLSGAGKAVIEADALYADRVEAPLLEVGAYTRYRYWVFPYFKPSGGLIGLWDTRSNYSASEALEVLRFVSERVGWSAEAICAQAEAVKAIAAGDGEEGARLFNAAMLQPAMRAVWSVDLGSLSPSRGRFRELAFEFH